MSNNGLIKENERYSTNEKGNEYLNVKVVYSKILKAKQQEKSVENRKELNYSTAIKGCLFLMIKLLYFNSYE